MGQVHSWPTGTHEPPWPWHGPGGVHGGRKGGVILGVVLLLVLRGVGGWMGVVVEYVVVVEVVDVVSVVVVVVVEVVVSVVVLSVVDVVLFVTGGRGQRMVDVRKVG